MGYTFWFDTFDTRAIIEPHKFYVLQARQRLLSQFNDISREADEAEQAHYKMLGQYFDPERDDPADSVEAAFNEGISHYLALHEMHNTITLALTAGMFHQFDKALREKMVREFRHWQPAAIDGLIWNVEFPLLIDLLEWAGVQIKAKPFYVKLDACQLLVNVYKHGKGRSHRDLVSKYPEYYPSAYPKLRGRIGPRPDELKVSEAQFVEIADAITNFWQNFPEFANESDKGIEPQWFASRLKRFTRL
ncbi:hypothetical protein [Serratia proteamaculans]